MSKSIKNVRARIAAATIGIAAPGVLLAQAASPGDAVFTQATADVTNYGSKGFVLLALLLSFWIGMKLVKKFVSKAT